MSRCEVDYATYIRLIYGAYLDRRYQGKTIESARRLAYSDVSLAFTCADDAIALEQQEDLNDELRSDWPR